MANSRRRSYRASEFGEQDLIRDFLHQLDDAKSYFLSYTKPRLDRSYKLYIAYTGDRQREIQKWQSNIFVPYTQAVIETLKPRILDARPDFSVQGRTPEDEPRAEKIQHLADYYWEKAEMDKKVESLVSAAMIFGTGFLQVFWNKDVRKLQFLRTDDMSKKLVWKEESRTFYDAPSAEWVDNYNLWYDWRNVDRKDKKFWFKRLILNLTQIKQRYPLADSARLDLIKPGGDMADYAHVRRDVKSTHELIGRLRSSASLVTSSTGASFGQNYGDFNSYEDLYEVFEWWRPMEDKYNVMVNNVPILKGGTMPNPYDFKECVFIDISYLRVPGEFEGYGIPLILESPQIMLNTIKNQRLDATTLNIHKMWIVNPLANIDKKELVTRPFGIIYSTDPQGVREVQFSDVKASAFQEETLLKNDMRYASGVDDFSMGVGGTAGSATEVRHLRESTIERVRLFVNHLGDGFATLQRYWMSMTRQFFTEKMTIRILGTGGEIEWPLIEKDDIMGDYDFKATVLPSIAGQNEVKKKQDMDLLQLLLPLPFIDQPKLVAKLLYDWNWDPSMVMQKPNPVAGPPGMPPGLDQGSGAGPGVPPGATALPNSADQQFSPGGPNNDLNPEMVKQAMALLGQSMPPAGGASGPSPFAQAGMPITLDPSQLPPIAPGIPQGGPITNSRGLNRKLGGPVDTNISTGVNTNPDAQLLTRTYNTQR